MIPYKLSINIHFIKFILLTLKIIHIQSTFKHNITPNYKTTNKKYTFNFHINYIINIITYNQTSLQNFPIYSNNKTLFKKTTLPKKNPNHYYKNTPLSKKNI